MNENDGKTSAVATRLSKGYAFAFLFLAFFVYPLALLPQVMRIGSWYNNLSFQISIPAFLVLGVLAIPVIIANRWRVPWSLAVGLAVFLVFWFINTPALKEYWDEFATLLGCITIPLAAAILREKKILTVTNLAYTALGIWVVQIALGIASLARHQPVVGTPGNINWMAALLLIVSPWVFMAIKQLAQKKLAPRPSAVLALLVMGVPTGIMLYHCHSRAAWAALFIAPLALVFLVFKTRLEKVLYGGLLLTLVVGSVMIGYRLVPGRLLRVIEQDVRLPLWTSTVGMMVQHPWGVGSGEFQRTFTPYRVGTYHSRLYAADMTIHPHNELLNLSAQLGIPVLFALLVLVSPLIRGNFNSPLVNCARLSALFVVFQSCFDMPLVQPPVNVLGYLMIGLCWPLVLKPQETSAKVWRNSALVSLLPVCLIAGYFTWHDLRSDMYIRTATLEKHLGQRTVQEGNKYRQNKDLFTKFQAQAGAHYNESKRLFELAVSPHRSVKAHYEAGLIALNIQQDAANAKELLQTVTRIDPDYAHINLLLGRLSLLEQDLQRANYHFARECMLYPRNSDAWQTMYNFSFRSGQYNRCPDIQNELEAMYSERIRLVFPGRQLEGERRTMLEYLADDAKKAETLKRANTFMVKVNQKTMDPVFIDLVMGEEWPAKLLGDTFDELDYLYWEGRMEKWKDLKGFKQVPSVPELVTWFCTTITPRPDRPGFELPLTVGKNKRGNLISRYAAFSDYVNLLGGQTVIELDDQQKPVCAWVFVGKIRSEKLTVNSGAPKAVIKLDFSDISAYKVDLTKAAAELKTLDTVKQEFTWEKERTVVYFAPEEYFMRTQVFATMLGEDYDFLDRRPPSLRLLELFWITGQEPPTPPLVHAYCFRPVLDLYKGFYETARNKIEGIPKGP